MHEQIDFSKAVLLQPRKDSWEKVVARIQEKKEKENLFPTENGMIRRRRRILKTV